MTCRSAVILKMNRWQTAPESIAQNRSKKAEQLSGSLNTVNTVTSCEPSSGFKLKRNKQQRTKHSKNTPLRANGNVIVRSFDLFNAD